jgi:hypothetical protein
MGAEQDGTQERQICVDRAMSAVPPLATKMLSRSKRAPCGDPRIFSAPVLPGRTGVLRATHESALSYCSLADLKRLAVWCSSALDRAS